MGILDVPGVTPGQLTTRLSEVRRRRPSFIPAPMPLYSPAPTVALLQKSTGVSAVVLVSGGTGYAVGEVITIGDGTSTYAAKLYVSAVDAGVITGVSVHLAGSYTVQPANPATQGSSTLAGTGATFTLTWNASVASSIPGMLSVPASTVGAYDFVGIGPMYGPTGFYGNASGAGSVACWFEWTTDATTLDLRLIGSNSIVQLYIDGKRLQPAGISTDASGAPYIFTLDFGGVPTIRTFKLSGANMAFAGLRVPANASVWKPYESRRPLGWAMGDSYTFGTGALEVTHAHIDVMAELLGMDILKDGVGSSGWTGGTAGTPAARVATRLVPITKTPDFIFWALGYNNGGGTPDPVPVIAGMSAGLAAAKAAQPNVPQIVFGPATPQGPSAGLSTIETAMIGVCATYGAHFISMQGWVTVANRGYYTGTDLVHPNAVGHEYLGQRMARAVDALLATLP